MRTRLDGIVLVQALAVFAVALSIVPLLGTFIGSISAPGAIDTFTLGNFAALGEEPDLADVLLRTLVLGLGSVSVAMAFALPLAWVLARTDFRWKTGLFAVLAAKLAIPGFIVAMAYVWLFNPSAGLVNQVLGMTAENAAFDIYQLKWLCLLQGIVMVPGAVFMLLPALSNLDPALEEAALTSGVTRAVAFRRITLPLLLPAVLAVGVFYFIIAIEMFDFVAIIGVPGDVIVQRIYRALTDNRGGVPGYGRAGVLGLILFAVCAIAIAYYVRLLRDARRFAVVGGKRRQAAPIPLGRWHIAASALALLWLTLAVVLPVITLVWVAVTPFFGPPTAETLATLNLDGFRDAIDYLPEPLGRTALVMVGTIVGAIAMGLSLSWVVTRRRDRLARAADGLVFLAPAVPTVVVATAFQILGLGLYQWVPLYGTVALMVAAMSTRLLAYTTRTMNAAALQLAPELEEAAVTSGVSPGRTFAAVFAPLMRPAIFYAALMAGMLAARDLTLPLIMGAGREPLLSVLIYDLQTNGEYASAAGIALILIVMLVGLAVAARRLTGLGEGGERA